MLLSESFLHICVTRIAHLVEQWTSVAWVTPLQYNLLMVPGLIHWEDPIHEWLKLRGNVYSITLGQSDTSLVGQVCLHAIPDRLMCGVGRVWHNTPSLHIGQVGLTNTSVTQSLVLWSGNGITLVPYTLQTCRGREIPAEYWVTTSIISLPLDESEDVPHTVFDVYN